MLCTVFGLTLALFTRQQILEYALETKTDMRITGVRGKGALGHSAVWFDDLPCNSAGLLPRASRSRPKVIALANSLEHRAARAERSLLRFISSKFGVRGSST